MLTDADMARQDREDMAEDAQWCEVRLRDLGGSVAREALDLYRAVAIGSYYYPRGEALQVLFLRVDQHAPLSPQEQAERDAYRTARDRRRLAELRASMEEADSRPRREGGRPPPRPIT